MKRKTISVIIALMFCLSFVVPTFATVELIARPTVSTVLVNGENVAFDAYNIDGNNYFKLRDLAYALNGTEKQFEVEWLSETNAIMLIGKHSYTETGGEMEGKVTENKTPVPSQSKIMFTESMESDAPTTLNLIAYNIDGNNYFKLRDIGEVFDFGVDWDGATNTIVIDTSKGYTAEQSGVLYKNEQIGFSIVFPASWEGKYSIETTEFEYEGVTTWAINVFHKASQNDKFPGELFSLGRVTGEGFTEDNPPILAGWCPILAQADGYTYFANTPSGVEYNEAADSKSGAEYKEMYDRLESIFDSFELLK